MSGYVTLNNINLEQEYGMKLTTFTISSPSPITKYIDVPGRPGKLDATLALNGKVNLSTRQVSATFHVRDCTYSDWHTLLSVLNTAFNGTESKIVFSSDPNWYYKGRFKIDTKKSNQITSTITISCNEVFPYKLESFSEYYNISSTLQIIVTGKEYNSTMTICSSSVLSLVFEGTTYQIIPGTNMMYAIHLKNGNNTLYFSGTGSVTILFERGVQ